MRPQEEAGRAPAVIRSAHDDRASRCCSPQVPGRWLEQAWSGLAPTVVDDVRWDSPEVERAWVREGLHLAHEVQARPEVEVHYGQGGDSRPVRARRD